MNKPTCPHCGEELNLGSIMAKSRWDKTSKKKRSEFSAKLHEAKKQKHLSTVK
jgi:hypothetical protein